MISWYIIDMSLPLDSVPSVTDSPQHSKRLVVENNNSISSLSPASALAGLKFEHSIGANVSILTRSSLPVIRASVSMLTRSPLPAITASVSMLTRSQWSEACN